MRKILFILICASLFCFANTAEAQGVYLLQNGSKVLAFKTASEVMTNLEDGDTLYLPPKMLTGNTSNSSSGKWEIDKRVHIVGAGYHPDSARATGITKISEDFYFNKGSKGSTMTGVRVEGCVYVKDSEIMITRSDLGGIYVQNDSEPISLIGFSDCVIRGNINGGNDVVTDCFIVRCIIHGRIGQGDKTNNMIIKNCILTHNGSNRFDSNAFIYKVQNLIIENSILTGTEYYYVYNSSSLTFKNNLFVRSSVSGTSFILENNAFNVPLADIFEDFENGDYRIKSSCTQAFNRADDGREVGIYGTSEPFLVPTYAPRFISIDNAGSVENGKLNVKMKVEARDR